MLILYCHVIIRQINIRSYAMSITAKELAKQLNLSEAAISMALNNKPGVSTLTRKRVLEAAASAGYDFQEYQIPMKLRPPMAHYIL